MNVKRNAEETKMQENIKGREREREGEREKIRNKGRRGKERDQAVIV